MSNVLSQDEVNSLLHGISGGDMDDDFGNGDFGGLSEDYTHTINHPRIDLETNDNKISVDDIAVLLKTVLDVINELEPKQILNLCSKNPNLRKLIKNPPPEMMMADL